MGSEAGGRLRRRDDHELATKGKTSSSEIDSYGISGPFLVGVEPGFTGNSKRNIYIRWASYLLSVSEVSRTLLDVQIPQRPGTRKEGCAQSHGGRQI